MSRSILVLVSFLFGCVITWLIQSILGLHIVPSAIGAFAFTCAFYLFFGRSSQEDEDAGDTTE